MSPRKTSPFSYEYILLGILNLEPRHGYEVYKEMARLEGIGLVWQVKQSQIYSLLDKLEKQGLIAATLIPGVTRPDRKQYRLTDAGGKRLRDWMESPVEHTRDMRQDFLGRLYFARLSGREATVALLERQRAACQRWQQSLQSQFDQLGGEQVYEQLVFRFRIAQVEAMLRWLDFCQRFVPGGDPLQA